MSWSPTFWEIYSKRESRVVTVSSSAEGAPVKAAGVVTSSDCRWIRQLWKLDEESANHRRASLHFRQHRPRNQDGFLIRFRRQKMSWSCPAGCGLCRGE